MRYVSFAGGLDTVLTKLAEGVSIRFNTVATEVTYETVGAGFGKRCCNCSPIANSATALHTAFGQLRR